MLAMTRLSPSKITDPIPFFGVDAYMQSTLATLQKPGKISAIHLLRSNSRFPESVCHHVCSTPKPPVLTHPCLLGWDGGEERSVGLLPPLQVILGSGQGTRQTIVVVDALDTVSLVEVLDQSDLVAGCTTRAGDDGGVGQEKLPDLQTKSACDKQSII